VVALICTFGISVPVRKSVFSGGKERKKLSQKKHQSYVIEYIKMKKGGRGIEAGFIHDIYYFFESTRTRFLLALTHPNTDRVRSCLLN
jgi:hypothetical protein